MKGKFYIDGIDAYKQFGVFISDAGLVSLLQYPPLKKLDSNDWPEEDGEEFDLSEPVLDTKTVQMKFASHKSNRFNAFVSALSGTGYHNFEIPAIEQTFRLRLSDQQSMNHYLRAESFTLQFEDDFPLLGYSYVEPEASIMRASGYELDGIDLGRYGTAVLEGSIAEVLKSPAVKQNLLVNLRHENGVIYDGKYVVFKTKDVTLKCSLRAKKFDEFWRNYKALLYDLTRPNERQLFVEYCGYEYPCYYKNCSSSKFLFTQGKIWWVFDLTLVFTSFRVEGEEYLLSSEDNKIVITEQNDNAINLSQYAD